MEWPSTAFSSFEDDEKAKGKAKAALRSVACNDDECVALVQECLFQDQEGDQLNACMQRAREGLDMGSSSWSWTSSSFLGSMNLVHWKPRHGGSSLSAVPGL
jgi:hypothetical protein